MFSDNRCKFNDCNLCANYDNCTKANFKQDDLKKLDDRLSSDVTHCFTLSFFGFLFSILALIFSIVTLIVTG